MRLWLLFYLRSLAPVAFGAAPDGRTEGSNLWFKSRAEIHSKSAACMQEASTLGKSDIDRVNLHFTLLNYYFASTLDATCRQLG